MPRAKIPMRLITEEGGDDEEGAGHATLCDVGVAVVVCSGPGGGAPGDVWESEEGVIRRYRALPPEMRGGPHTHLNYAKGELGKEKARLARTRQAGPLALAHSSLPEAALKDVALEELLSSIDAALLAAAERRKALGLPDVVDDDDDAEEGGRLGQAGAPCIAGEGFEFEGGMDGWDDGIMWDGARPIANVTQPAPGAHYYTNGRSINQHQQLQTMPGGNGNSNINSLSQFAWDAAYQPNANVMHPGGHGYHFSTDSNSYVDVNYGSQMQMVPGSVDAPSSSHAFAPDSTAHMSTQHCAPGIVGDNFTGAPGVGMGGNDSVDANLVSEYTTTQCCFADDLQCPYTSQDFGLNYLGDIADGVHF